MPSNNRSQIIEKGAYRIILDAYNANPNSMQAALENLAQLSIKRVAILGDMFEIDTESLKRNTSTSPTLFKIGQKAYLIGQNFSKIAVKNENTIQFRSFEEFKSKFDKNDIMDSTILIKASRGMSLERVLELI
ncbi:MAG: cyanophycin synthetase [Flavobacteriaceae bacterium]|nr:cyanophycin synthetase [Flavobacteriaceae bacterium]